MTLPEPVRQASMCVESLANRLEKAVKNDSEKARRKSVQWLTIADGGAEMPWYAIQGPFARGRNS
jgi:hypothetical protein